MRWLLFFTLIPSIARADVTRDQMCPSGKDWAITADAPGLNVIRQYGCGVYGDFNRIIPEAWKLMDQGVQDPILPAGVVAACVKLNGYLQVRLCRIDQALVDEAALASAVAATPTTADAQKAFLDAYQKGKAHLAGFDLAGWETDHPTEKKLADDTIAQVEKYYAPIFATWEPKLVELEAWETKANKNAEAAAGCLDTYTKLLQSYVTQVVPKADGDALLRALRDPVGSHIAEALALCYRLRNENGGLEASRRLDIANIILAGADTTAGLHDARYRLIDRALRARSYKGDPLGTAPNAFEAMVSKRYVAGDPSGVAPLADAPTQYNPDFEFESVTPKDKGVLITFPKKQAPRQYDDCETDYTKFVGLDSYGNARYGTKNCVTKNETIDVTKRPVLVPSDQAAMLVKGVTVVLDAKGYPSDESDSGIVLFVKKGKDVVGVMGVTAP
jgi:hypothetical protein